MPSRDDRTSPFCSERMKICQSHLSRVYSRSKKLLVSARSGKVVPEVTGSAARGFVEGQSNAECGDGLSRFEKTKISPYLNAVSALFEGPSLLKCSQLREAHTLLADRHLKNISQPNCPHSCNENPSDDSASVPLFSGVTLTGHDYSTLASGRPTAGEPSEKDPSIGQSTAGHWKENVNGDDFVDPSRTTGNSDQYFTSRAAVTSGVSRGISSGQSTALVKSARAQSKVDRELLFGPTNSIEEEKTDSHLTGEWSVSPYLLSTQWEETKVPRLVFPQPHILSNFPQSSSNLHVHHVDGSFLRSRPSLPLGESPQGPLSSASVNGPSRKLQIAPYQRRAITTTRALEHHKVDKAVEWRQLEDSRGIEKTCLDLSPGEMPALRSELPELLAGNDLMLKEELALSKDGNSLLLGNDSQSRLPLTAGGGRHRRDFTHIDASQLPGRTKDVKGELVAGAEFQNGSTLFASSGHLSAENRGQNTLNGFAAVREYSQTSGKDFSGEMSTMHSKHRTTPKTTAGNLEAPVAERNLRHKPSFSAALPNTESFGTGGPGTDLSGFENPATATNNRRQRFAKFVPDNKDEDQTGNAAGYKAGPFASRLSAKSSNSSSALQASISNYFGVASGRPDLPGTLTVKQFHDAICDHSSPDCPDFRKDKWRQQEFRSKIASQEQDGDRQTDAVGEVVDLDGHGDGSQDFVNGDGKCAQYNYEVRTDMKRQERSASTLWKYGNMAVCTEDPRKDYLSGEVPPSALEMAGKKSLEVSGVHWSRSGSRKVVSHVSQLLKQNKWGNGVIDQLNAMRGIVSSHCVNAVLQQQKDPTLSLSFFNWAKLQKGYKHDVFAFTTMINILGRARNLMGVRHLLEDMHEAGVEPTAATYNTLILCYGRVESLSESLRVFRIMQEAGCKPDNVTYSILIHLCIKAGYLQEGLKLYQSMREAGVQPDTITYSIVIDSLGKSGNLREARKLFCEMKERGHVPNEFTYNSLIDRHAKACKTQRALKFFTEMRLAGFKLNAVVCTTMMGVLGNLGKYDEAESLFAEMQQAGIAADTAAYGLMINIWGNAGDLDKAVSWYGRMLGNLVTPSLTVFGSLVNAHLKANLYEAAQHFLTSMGMWGIAADLKLYTILLRHCTVCDRQEHADAILGIMDRLGHPAHHFLYELLTSKQQDADSIRSRITSFLEAVEHEDQESLQGFANALVDFLHKLQSKTDPGVVWEIGLEKGLFPSSTVRREAPNHWLVDLHSMCIGTALVALPRLLVMLKERWVENPTKRVYVVTGWGRRSRVTGTSALKKAVNNVLEASKSPFALDSANAGVFVSLGPPFHDWISRPSVLKKLGAFGSQGIVER